MADENQSSNDEVSAEIQYAFFMIDDKPYCFWDVDIPTLTLDFLESIDPKYFEYLGNTYFSEDTEASNLLASLALRTAYSQALETFFAFVAATLQAPQCVPAWITTYWPSELKNVVEKITNNQPFPTILKRGTLSWQHVSDFIYSWLVLEDKSKEKRIKKNFASLWSKFASDFLDEGFSNEYNSIKHGFRVRPGGFHLSIGINEKPGEPAPREKMRLLGKSEYGSSYLSSQQKVFVNKNRPE